MSDDVTRLVEEVRRLSSEDRVRLVARVLAMLAPDQDIGTLWAADVERRSSEIDRGVVEGQSWAEVKERAGRLGDESR